jgi:hypothetical protein
MTQTAGTFATLDTLTARDLMGHGAGSIHLGASWHLIVVDEDGCCAGVLGSARAVADVPGCAHPRWDE